MQMDSRKLDLGMNGMSIENGDNSIKVDEASLKGFDWSSSIKAISELAGLDDTEIETFPFNRLIPELGTIRVGGINVDVAAPEKSDEEANEETKGTPERVKFTLKNFEMGLTKPFNGIPTDITIRQDDLTLPIPADSSEEVLVEARKLGIESLALSYGLSAGWDEPNNNLMIREISFSGKDIGSVNFSGLAVEALGRFISTPGTLTVTVKSTGANGLGLLDLVAASDNPMLLLDKVDIQATAE